MLELEAVISPITRRPIAADAKSNERVRGKCRALNINPENQCLRKACTKDRQASESKYIQFKLKATMRPKIDLPEVLHMINIT
jgi:hypothetical protein